MELTGKCAEKFKEWAKDKGIEKFNSKDYSLNVAKVIYNAILIEFFDSIGIIVLPQYSLGNWWFEIKDISHIPTKRHIQVEDSELITKSYNLAIKKANEIYNLGHGRK